MLRPSLQGEVLEQQFGEAEVAFRTLDLYTSAVLEVRTAGRRCCTNQMYGTPASWSASFMVMQLHGYNTNESLASLVVPWMSNPTESV